MPQDQTELLQQELNDLLEAYEHARAVDDDVDLEACLPRRDHPLYVEARREVVRLDLEYSWQGNHRRRISYYLTAFPDLLDDKKSVQEIAFEEYRLRVLAGEDPSAAEYERTYGVSTSRWPGSDAEFENYSKTILADESDPDDDLDTLTNRVNTPPLEWDMLAEADGARSTRRLSASGKSAQALLRLDDSQSCAQASFLLAQALTTLPEVGTRFLNFQLIGELGRGSFGRVYLARQSGLANRLVALKLTVELSGEEQKLAQLQHTNVVPIYSAHKAGPLHAVCMPYFGPTTLGDVVKHSRAAGGVPARGASLVETLLARSGTFPVSSTSAERNVIHANLNVFQKTSFVDAVLLLAEQVAEGLMHAHERGILHGDLKPANILLTDDGAPMLLDFNLATDIKVRAGLSELRVGGTLPYMAPEHLTALQDGDKKHVDARSDIYSLGVILFELLTGRLPFETLGGPLATALPAMIAERRKTPPYLRNLNPAISPAVESIVRHCLEPDPQKRYQSAEDFHEDLQRHRRHLPLKHAHEPSLNERARKWVRRHPRLTGLPTMILVMLFILAAMLSPGAWQAWQDWQTDRTKLADAEIEADLAKQKNAAAQKQLQTADERARGAEARIQALDRFRQFQASASVTRAFLNAVTLARVRPETWTFQQDRIAQQTAECRKLLGVYGVLDKQTWSDDLHVQKLPEAEGNQLRIDVASALFALAEAEQLKLDRFWPASTQVALPTVAEAGFAASVAEWLLLLDRALQYNAQAACCFADVQSPRAFLMQRAALERRRSAHAEAERLSARADQQPLRDDTDDAYWTAAAFATRHDFKSAENLLAHVTRQRPDHFGAWRLRALCHQSAGEYRKAETSWDTAAALAPDDEWVRYCRGEVCLQLSKWSDARDDFAEFIKKHPTFRKAYLHRAAAWQGLAHYARAIEDLTTAIDLGPAAPELLFQRYELKYKNDDKKGAQQDRIRLVASEPTDINGWIYRGMIQAEHNPKAALADLERALAIDSNNVIALYKKAELLSDRLLEWTDAVGVLNRLLFVDPNHADARLKRGLLYAKLGFRTKAVADAERALERDVTPARSYLAACIYAYTSIGQPADAPRVMEHLAGALRNGYAKDRLRVDPNLPLDHIPEAEALLRVAPFIGPAPVGVKR